MVEGMKNTRIDASPIVNRHGSSSAQWISFVNYNHLARRTGRSHAIHNRPDAHIAELLVILHLRIQGNRPSINWLRRLGCAVGSDVQTIGGEPFVRFVRCAHP